MKTLIRSIVLTLILGILLCGVYPLCVTLLGKAFFLEGVDGGIITLKDGRRVGAHLIGQNFKLPRYFHGRPSAAGEKGYDAASSSGSNLGPTSQKFADGLKGNVETVMKENPSLKQGAVPVDLVTASGSGLDPHISPEGAFVQVERVAQERGMDLAKVRGLVEAHIEGPQWGIFGESRVNVLALNLALDANPEWGAQSDARESRQTPTTKSH